MVDRQDNVAPIPNALKLPAIVALAAAILVVEEMSWVTNASRRGLDASLVYPYLASSAVFVTIVTWVIASIRSMPKVASASALPAFGVVFLVVFLLMLRNGIAGTIGENAVDDLNWYLAEGRGIQLWSISPLRVVAAAGIALSLGCFVFVARVCIGVSSPPKDAGVEDVLDRMTQLNKLMVDGSALFVASVVTLFLLFASAAQVHALRPLKHSSEVQPPTASPVVAKVSLSLSCQLSASASQSDCVVEPAAIKSEKQASSAATMALVLGLAFTGALFILFSTCSGILDDSLDALARIARSTDPSFNAKTWREAQGISESASDRVLKAVTLLAPALAGMLTIITGG